MSTPDRMEIYIPVDAEVKSIPLLSLPSSVLNKMGVPLCDSNGTKKLQDSPEGIWICPVVIRRKGQTLVSHAGNGVKENMLSLLDRQSQSASGSFRMSFVSSNRVAYKVLYETMPGSTVSSASSLPHSLSPQTCQDAVVIYRGQIYLSIRRTSRRQNQQDTHQPKPASRSSSPSTSVLPSKRQKELLNDNKPKKKLIRCKVTHSENKKGVENKVRDVPSSETARSVPQSTDSVHTADDPCHKDTRKDQTTEEATVQDQACRPPPPEAGTNDGGECEVRDLGSEAAESADQNSDMYSDTQIDGGDVGQGDTNSWISGEPQAVACASTSILDDFDFKELAQEEMIAQMKARLRKNEAALGNLNS
ncbi:uncharacterized protein [Channa argus]|uniref:uncharacterized protein n=1 Tax=Channa argus TaxID=215402 RepID=UPI0035227AA8